MQIVVIADDLTGANATGVKLSKEGFSTATVVRSVSLPDENFQALCINTDSRYEKMATANNRVKEALNIIHKKGIPTVYSKRIDSTLRGNIGTEIDAMLDALGNDSIAVVVASFPESGRVTCGGFLLIDGVPLQETDVAQDPIAPITSSKVTDIISIQTNKKIEPIGLDNVLKGEDHLTELLQKKAEYGNRIVVVDAVTSDQIKIIAQAMRGLNRPLLAVDPGPLTAAYSKCSVNNQHQRKKILVVVGSITPLTGLQLTDFIDKWNINPIYVNPEKVATFTNDWNKEVNDVVEKASKQIQHEKVTLVTTFKFGKKRLDLRKIALKESVSEERLARRITDGLAAISREIMTINKGHIGGCFLSGGDVTSSLCSATHSQGIKLEDEVLPLASSGTFISGFLHGIPVVTKGGLIGDKNAISECVQYLQNKVIDRSEQTIPKTTEKVE
jgi:uncharacterized protein YgbK (DUF1537 family)